MCTIPTQQDLERLKGYVDSALDVLYTKDKYLIENKVHERTIVARFVIYLEAILLQDNIFSQYDLDMEYNRDLKGTKRSTKYPEGRYPDIVLHKRGKGSIDDIIKETNLMILEFKKNKRGIEEDKEKVRDMMNPEVRNYKIGAVILFNKTRETTHPEWLQLQSVQ